MHERIYNVNWDEIQKLHKNGMFLSEILKKFHMSCNLINRAVKEGLFVKIKLKQKYTKERIEKQKAKLLKNHKVKTIKHTEETKRHLSEKRKQWLKENPDKHVWKRKDKFISIPCEHFKERLRKQNINFVEEYSPLQTNSFSLDIAFPDKKIAIEINGEQHYNRDGTLKDYYQKRHDLIEQDGWKIIEFKSSMVYNKELSENLIDGLKSQNIGNIDYEFYINEQKRITEERVIKKNEKQIKNKKAKKIKIIKKKFFCTNCGIKTNNTKHNLCNICVKEKLRKVERPSKEQLQQDINSMSLLQVGKKYCVSDNSIRKWMKLYNIVKIKKKLNHCSLCGKVIKSYNKYCRNCYNSVNGYIYNKENPTKEQLIDALKTMKINDIAKNI